MIHEYCIFPGLCLCRDQDQPSSSSQTMDVMEAENVLLECRFQPAIMDYKPRFFWIRTNRNGHDNVAIGDSPLENNYS